MRDLTIALERVEYALQEERKRYPVKHPKRVALDDMRTALLIGKRRDIPRLEKFRGDLDARIAGELGRVPTEAELSLGLAALRAPLTPPPPPVQEARVDQSNESFIDGGAPDLEANIARAAAGKGFSDAR